MAFYGQRGETSSIAFAKSEAAITEGWNICSHATPRELQRSLVDVTAAAAANSAKAGTAALAKCAPSHVACVGCGVRLAVARLASGRGGQQQQPPTRGMSGGPTDGWD